MKINKKVFKKHYQAISGEELDSEDIPSTYVELFEENSDPEEFDEELAFLMEAAKLTLEETGHYQDLQFDTFYAASDDVPRVLLGDVRVKGDAYIDTHTFIIGNLQVDGVLYGEEHCILALSGDIRAGGLCLIRTYAYVAGNIQVDQLTLIAAYGFLMLRGKLRSPVYIDDQTISICELDEDSLDQESPDLQKIKSPHIMRPENFKDTAFIKQLKEIYKRIHIYTDSDGTWLFDQTFRLISEGKQLIK